MKTLKSIAIEYGKGELSNSDMIEAVRTLPTIVSTTDVDGTWVEGDDDNWVGVLDNLVMSEVITAEQRTEIINSF